MSPDLPPPTEAPLSASAGLDAMTPLEALAVFDRADRAVLAAVRAARPEIARAVELVSEALAAGGRLLYVGAGTSGRLGVLDAVECPPTFGCSPDTVQARLAGGARALLEAVEGAEDSREEGRRAVDDATRRDVVVGISASGTTPFVRAALERAGELGARTVLVACVPAALVPDPYEVSIRLATGPEVLAGSTRLKAATATKMVLNRITTLAFARLGAVFDNRMVGLRAGTNAKLTRRATALVAELGETSIEDARALLGTTGGDVRTAILMARGRLELAAARDRLAAAGGHLRHALAGLAAAPRIPAP